MLVGVIRISRLANSSKEPLEPSIAPVPIGASSSRVWMNWWMKGLARSGRVSVTSEKTISMFRLVEGIGRGAVTFVVVIVVLDRGDTSEVIGSSALLLRDDKGTIWGAGDGRAIVVVVFMLKVRMPMRKWRVFMLEFYGINLGFVVFWIGLRISKRQLFGAKPNERAVCYSKMTELYF